MTNWPERPAVGNRPVIWDSLTARPADPQPGDFWESWDWAGRKVWTGSEWVPEAEYVV